MSYSEIVASESSAIPAGPLLEIRLFGELAVLRAGRPLSLPASKKTRALLAYLVTNQRTHNRGKLCELLWEGPDDPRAALRWSLSKIRPLIDEVDAPRLVADRERVAFESRGATTDLHELRSLADRGLEQSTLPTLERAADAIKGELLEGLDLPDCFRFNEWVRGERHAARRLGRAIRLALVERCEHDPEESLVHARALIATDPLDQSGHAAVIRLLGRLGRHREALRQYDLCRQFLSAQLNEAPSFELEHARMGIRSSSNPPGESSTEVVPPQANLAGFNRSQTTMRDTHATAGFGHLPDQRIVGRESERASLLEYLAQPNRSRGQILLLLGEPGVGKSCLLGELSATVQAQNGHVLKGRAFEAEMIRPYGAWIDALRALDPELDTPAPFALRSSPPIEGELDRHAVFDAVIERLRRLESKAPLTVVIIDDIQWIDEASAALIHYAARALAGSQIRLACAARPGELGDNPAALRLVRTMTREGKIYQIGLSPLDAVTTAALVRSRYPGVDAARVFEESGGNPMFALEVARSLEMGDGPTSSLDAMLQERLDQLEGVAKALLSWAAIFGRDFSLDHLLRASGGSVGEFMNAIDELERRGLLRALNEHDAASSYDFVHDLIRRAAYRAMSEPRRALMHLALARSLATTADAEGSLASDIAHHAALGNDPGLTCQFCLIAAERCLRMCAAREASELSERGLRQVSILDANERARLQVGLLRVSILADLSKTKALDRAASMRKAISQAQSAGYYAEAARGLMALAVMHFDNGNLDDAQRASLMMTETARMVDSNQSVYALAHAAQCLALLERDMDKAVALVAEAKEMAERHDTEVLELLLAQGFILQYHGDSAQARGLLERAYLLTEQQGVYWLGAICLLRLATGELLSGSPQATLGHCAQLRRVVGRLGETSEGPFGEVIEGVAHRQLGKNEQPDAIEGALKMLIALDAKAYLCEAYCLVADSELRAGNAHSAEGYAELGLLAAEASERTTCIAWARALLVRAALELGSLDRARLNLVAALALLDTQSQLSAHAREQIVTAACVSEARLRAPLASPG